MPLVIEREALSIDLRRADHDAQMLTVFSSAPLVRGGHKLIGWDADRDTVLAGLTRRSKVAGAKAPPPTDQHLLQLLRAGVEHDLDLESGLSIF